MNLRTTFSLALLAILSSPSSAWAGTITAQGNVTVLTDVGELQGIVGTATFDQGGDLVELDAYTPAGMTFHTGPLVEVLPGVTALGTGSQPTFESGNDYFPAPIGGAGVASSFFTYSGGVVTFTQPVTQFGLTGSRNGTQYITVWNTLGTMIGQVTWQPDDDAAFVGVATSGEPIGMLTFGNDNVMAGATYDVGGTTIISDTWIWALGVPCQTDADCMADANPCTPTLDVCMQGNCVGPNIEPGCCLVDDDCMPGEICMVDGNACIPDGDTTDTTGGDSTDTTGTTEGDSTTTEGDSTTTESGSTTTESESSGDMGSSGLDEVADDTSTSDSVAAPETDGCGCATEERSGPVFAMLGLALLGLLGRPRGIGRR